MKIGGPVRNRLRYLNPSASRELRRTWMTGVDEARQLALLFIDFHLETGGLDSVRAAIIKAQINAGAEHVRFSTPFATYEMDFTP